MPTPYALPGAELHLLEAKGTGRVYQLYVAVPPSRRADPARRYPTLYVIDPQWDFGMVTSILGNLLYDKAVPECLVVGVGYPGQDVDYERLRHRDLSPVAVPFLTDGREQGEAARFLSFVADEVVPFAERELGADPGCRITSGSSLAGLFGLYALLERPGLFHGVVAASPAVVWGDDWLVHRAERAAGAQLDARLFMSGAEDEWPNFLESVRRLDALLQTGPFPGLSYRWRLVEGERHCGTKAESFTRGLRYVLAPWAPEPAER